MKEVLERIVIAIEGNTRAVRDMFDYIKRRDSEMAEICTPTYKSSAELNALIIEERQIARARSLKRSIALEEMAPGRVINDVVAEEIYDAR